MGTPFTDFVGKLCNRKDLDRFNNDPDGEIRKAGLSKRHLVALKSRDTDRINELIWEEHRHLTGGGIKKCAIRPEKWELKRIKRETKPK